MASPQNLAAFVARTLDEAQKNGAKQTWIELSHHGAGDGGGLQADSSGEIMSIDGIAGAITRGIAMHAAAHPEDAGRNIDGLVANQCLMSSLGFADDLSHAGVKYLAASPETMLSPGTPSTVAHAIAQHTEDAGAMAAAVVKNVMHYQYGTGGDHWGPAACFDVLDLSPTKWAMLETDVRAPSRKLRKGALHRSKVRLKAMGCPRSPDAPRATAEELQRYVHAAQLTELNKTRHGNSGRRLL